MIDIEFRKGILFIRPKGFLTKTMKKELNELKKKIIKEEGFKYIVLNLNYLSLNKYDQNKIIMSYYYELLFKKGTLFICSNNNSSINILLKKVLISNNELDAYKYILL